MVEVIIGGAIMLVGGVVGAVVQHLLQRMRNKDEREARREDILYDKISAKQLEAYQEAVRALYFMNVKWIQVVESEKKIWMLNKTKAEGEGEGTQRKRMEIEKTLYEEREAVLDDFIRILNEAREPDAKIRTYLPLESGEGFQRYGAKAVEKVKWVKGLGEQGKREDFELAKKFLENEYESVVAILREQMGIED